jgi:hypothetical protein
LDAGRALVNRWLSQIPKDFQGEYLSRLRARSEQEHISALQELFLFNLLSNAEGLTPSLVAKHSGASRPDLLVATREKQIAFIEATVRHPDANVRTEHRMWTDLLHHCKPRVSPAIRLFVEEVRSTSTQPSARRFAAWINNWHHNLPADVFDNSASEPQETEAREYVDAHSGWRVQVRLGVVPGTDPTSEHLVATGPTTANWSEAPQRLLAAVKKKHKQHQTLDLPLIPAVSINDFTHEPNSLEIMNALYGDEIRASLMGDCASQQRSRELIYCSPCFPWSLHVMNAVLWIRAGSPRSEFASRWPFEIMVVNVETQEPIPCQGPLGNE